MPRKREKAAEHVRCENQACGHLMLADAYRATILPDTPAERIHRIYEPTQPERTLMCTCGHYTVHYAHRPSSQTME